MCQNFGEDTKILGFGGFFSHINLCVLGFKGISEATHCVQFYAIHSKPISDDVQEAQAGSPLVGSNSLGLSALKTATQVKRQHKYLNDCLKKSNICAEEHPSVSKHLSYLICEDVHERVHE